LDNPIIATDVSLKMFLHKGLKWHSEENPINDVSCLRTVGNANKETNVTLEYGKSELDIQGVSKLPFQVQIYFTKLDGSKCIRVISRHQDITTERSEAENNINIGVVGLHSVRETAKLAEEGNYSKARKETLCWKLSSIIILIGSFIHLTFWNLL